MRPHPRTPAILILAAALCAAPRICSGFWRRSPERRVAGFVEQLGAARYPVRERAQERLLSLSIEHFETVLDQSLETLLRSRDPEVRHRLIAVLRELALTRFFVRERGFLGVTLSHQRVQMMHERRIWDIIDIISVFPESAAQTHGVKAGDKIMQIDRRRVGDGFRVKEVVDYISAKQPGDTITLTLWSKQKKLIKTVTLGERPPLQGDPPLEVRREEFFRAWLKQSLAEKAAELGARP